MAQRIALARASHALHGHGTRTTTTLDIVIAHMARDADGARDTGAHRETRGDQEQRAILRRRVVAPVQTLLLPHDAVDTVQSSMRPSGIEHLARIAEIDLCKPTRSAHG